MCKYVPPYDSVHRLKVLLFTFPASWGRAPKNPWSTCHVATAARSVVLISVALTMGYSPSTPNVEFSVSPVKGLRLPGCCSEYENPTPKGCERKSKFETSLHEYGLTSVFRSAVTLQGPSSCPVRWPPLRHFLLLTAYLGKVQSRNHCRVHRSTKVSKAQCQGCSWLQRTKRKYGNLELDRCSQSKNLLQEWSRKRHLGPALCSVWSPQLEIL